MTQEKKERGSTTKSDLVIPPVITGIFAVITACIGAAAIIYAASTQKINQQMQATSTSIAETATQITIMTELAPTSTAIPSQTPLPTYTPQATYTPPPTYTLPPQTIQVPGSIPIDQDVTTNYDDFLVNVTSIDLFSGGRMRLNLYLWNKSTQDRHIIFDLFNCGYLANIDDGTQYQVLDSTIPKGFFQIQSQVKKSYWVEFEDIISPGVRNFTINLCPLTSGDAIRFKAFNVHINP